MKSLFRPLGFAVLLCLFICRSFASEPLVVPLWPEGVPAAKTNAGAEMEFRGRFTNVHNPTITVYAPDLAKSSGVAVIVAPGGGYVRVGDGRTDARWLNSLGITAFVLKYRVIDYGHPAPLQDILRAVRIVRSRADEFGVRADRIGVMGGSAGGHLSGCAATMWDSPEGRTGHALDAVSARPNFAILIYPVVTMESPSVHRGSRYALFGAEPTPEQMQSLSLEKNVRSNSPPFFLVATMADASVRVENSLMLYQSLRNAGVPAEMHVYAAGSHGNSLDPRHGPTAKWPERCEEWLRFNKWLPPEQHDFARWEKDIAAFEASDQTNSPSKGRAVFTGSSTIRMWKSLPQDLPGLQPINRGFGGSDIEDALHFADRIVFPYQPRSVYLRAGGNDLWNGKTPEEVFVHFKEFVETVQKRSPRTEITFISWSPTLARWSQAQREKKLNELVAAYVKGKSRLHYIETYDVPLGPDGKPRAELFLSDKLHFNEAGYKLLAERMRQSLRR